MKTYLSLTAVFVLAAGPALADSHLAAEGEKVFRKCQACHQVGEGAVDKAGPVLTGVVGRTAGSLESFASKYSDAMKAAGEGGLVWNEDELEAFLAKPRDYVKGTKMSFAGLRKEEEVEAVIAYLQSFSE